MSIEKTFAGFANATSKATGSPWAFCACLAMVIGWAASGPVFQFSETWQLVINTGTTIITFLMVFLIQNTQNRDSAAIQAKLDDIILMSGAENEFIGIERLTDTELKALRERCAARAKGHADMHEMISAEAEKRAGKHKGGGQARRGKAPARRAAPAKVA
jgi:low affinity Fe/Cu permease